MDRSKLYGYSEGKHFEGKSTKEVFEEIASKNYWIEEESSSGFGSTMEQTREIVSALPSVLKAFKVKKVLDLPCGDFNWMKLMDLSNLEYTGGDIVKNLIIDHQKSHVNTDISFVHLDILKDDLGQHDMLFCRDCLVHFSYRDIHRALNNIKKSKITYLMTTTFPDETNNRDIVTGGWRPLNLEKEPFNFPKPLYFLNEGCTEMDGIFADKSLGLWKIEDL